MSGRLRAKICEPTIGREEYGFAVEVEFHEGGIRGHDGVVVIHLQNPRSEADALELRDTINRLADTFHVTK